MTTRFITTIHPQFALAIPRLQASFTFIIYGETWLAKQ